MAYTNLADLFKGICDAIRAKKGTTGVINHQDIPSEIASITTGITPADTISITSNGIHDVTSYAQANVNVPTSSWSCEEGFATPNDDSTYLHVSGITRDDPCMLIVLSVIELKTDYEYAYIANMLYTRDWYVREGQYQWQSIFVQQFNDGDDTWAEFSEWNAPDTHYEFYIEGSKFVIHLNTTGSDRFRGGEQYTVLAFYDS